MYRVVIADDEVLIRMYIREILENNGYEVVGEAEDGLDAIAVCRQKKPDFVIMDINMPVMTGLEATKVINEDKLAGFVIILTAYRDKEIADQAVNTDVMGYIVKPVDEDTLIPAVKIATHNYKQREAMAKEFHKTQEALDDRKYLDRAKGLVMERKNMSEKEAFTYIRSLSMDKGISMTELSKMLLKAYEGDTKAEREFMEQKKNKLLSDMIQNDTDKKMVQLVEAATDLSCGDICTLLEVAHSLPFVGNLEGGDTYINVLTREKESMVIAQYRHPNYDLYKRSIIGEIERREDEPAVYRALEEGISGRGLIGIIDEGRTVVRHTVSPILNSEKKVIGALTYEYPNAGADTESIRIINNQEGKQDPFNRQLGKASDYLQDAILLYDANGICTFVNPKAEVLYQDKGFELPLIGRRCSELHITDCNWSDLTEHRGVIRREVRTPNFIMDAVISGIWENGTCQGAAIIFRDKTVVHQMEDEIAYRVALIHEVHHRVKNNLQTIISLIGLEAVHTKDEKVKAFAKTITSHVRSMNITYDLLSHTGSENVGLKVLISRITDVLLENNCLKETCSISTRVDGDDVILTETTASTVALIVNELVQNSLKYAFKDRKQGQIRLKIEKGASYSWITVQDDGCGFDNKKISRANSGLGLRLISSLVQSSLKGELFIETGENGTSIRFSFSMPQAG